MPATTPKGFPYPLGTDRLADGDDAIHSLATAVDTKLGVAAAGNAAVNVTTGGTASTLAVTFPVGLFTAAPVCVCTYQLAATTNAAVSAQSPTTTGFTISAVRATAGTMNVFWFAVQLP